MTGVFLQVRMNSTRLPGKALLDFPGGNVIQHAMRALRKVPVDAYVLATDTDSAPFLEKFAAGEKFEVFCGPRQDVLQRYILAANYYHTDTLIRATGDNPLVSARLAVDILKLHRKEKADLSHFLDLPIGAGVEVVQNSALIRAARQSRDPFEREHLTTHLYRNQENFKVMEIPCEEIYACPEMKISLDTQADFEFILHVYQELYKDEPIETDLIVQWYKKYREQEHVSSKREGRKNSFCSR